MATNILARNTLEIIIFKTIDYTLLKGLWPAPITNPLGIVYLSSKNNPAQYLNLN